MSSIKVRFGIRSKSFRGAVPDALGVGPSGRRRGRATFIAAGKGWGFLSEAEFVKEYAHVLDPSRKSSCLVLQAIAPEQERILLDPGPAAGGVGDDGHPRRRARPSKLRAARCLAWASSPLCSARAPQQPCRGRAP